MKKLSSHGGQNKRRKKVSTIVSVQTVCDRSFTVLKLHFEWIGHLYDIKILSVIVLRSSNYITYKFNRLIFFNNSHWLFNFD